MVKTPVVPVAVVLVTPVPPICGLALAEVREKTTPRAVIAAPPSLVALPPKVAEVEVMDAEVGVVKPLGADDRVGGPDLDLAQVLPVRGASDGQGHRNHEQHCKAFHFATSEGMDSSRGP